MSDILDAASVVTELASTRAPHRWAWLVPVVTAVVLVALVALIVGTTVFAADPMTGT